ncbi:2',3'-cyclic-nucleotide 2'-phosphodiesterase (5'-nucleotidase family) [Ruminiclostridium sufflavum DSM 19573]|uniref:2',3'-cyclic-nucleotide 2'-phosphodiesterase (5'-nucleotidase family) n=1 Tax=Ruminiclostridium sufflavum DSM 19573 TaxID=1121337 RepID=A0A318XT79_9FIRM|nr:5'-nucleotidase C-terminal domain-containing protein [Ruminiclostridium sufflavum]PYG89571.1 2',3'-cyclic-nucleotide 2'-phosphodiesterase (5'-nucleotidase family) [Ruminiclostridium sufflavum DSM 19573]
MKKYTNLIVIGVILVGIAGFLIYKNVNFNDVLMSLGYYDQKISVVNTADVHGHICFDDESGGYYTLDQVDVMMGLPMVKHFVDEIKKGDPDALVLDSGDLFHGTNEANIEKAKGVVEVANLLGYDAMTMGNHDFDFGIDRAIEFKTQLNYPIICANVLKDGKPIYEEYKIVEIDGLKVGLFGTVEKDALIDTNSRDHQGMAVEDPIITAQRLIPIIKKQADVIIYISHNGDEIDKQIIEKVDGIDLFLCGHHHFLYEKPDKVNNTYLVEAGGYTTHVGLAELYLKDGKVKKCTWKLFNSRDGSKADPEMKKVSDKYQAMAMEAGKEVVGKAEVKLNGMRSDLRFKETNLADLLADAMKETGKAEIALMNGGGIRESIPEGDISLYKIGKVLPFTNALVTIELKGEAIYKCLERGIMQYPNSGANGGFMQVSGIKFSFDASKPAGERVVSVKTLDGKELDKDKTYKVATNDYLYNGGDGYEEMVDAKLLYKGELLKDVLAKYIKEKGTVSPKEEGRISVVNERYK